MSEDKDQAEGQPQFEIVKRPICPQHGLPMRVYSVNRLKRYWRCRIEGCPHTRPMPRRNARS